jgi:hypothetical protein
MLVFKMPWKQETVNLESVVLALKTYSITREDFEHIINGEDGEELISWKHKIRLVSIFEVYPDEDSFRRRVLPITLVKDTHLLGEVNREYEEILWEKLKTKKDDLQEFWKGEVISIDV